jgi:dihydroneopterin aldolase
MSEQRERNMLPPDRLTLHQLEVETTIGVYDFERQLKQKLKITVHFSIDADVIAETDDLDSGLAIDYDRLSQTIRDFGLISEFCLLETFAVKLINHLFALYPLTWIQLEVTKIAALKKAQGVTLTLCRTSPSPV